MSRPADTRTKYLQTYAEVESQQALELFADFSTPAPGCNNAPRPFQNVLLIPACDENADFIWRLADRGDAENFLLILVINQAQGSPLYARNQALFSLLTTQGQALAQAKRMQLVQFGKLKVLVLDRFSEGQQIPPQQGVGLARKIAADIACALQAKHYIASPWLHCSDADAYLPENYFSAVQCIPQAKLTTRLPTSACVLAFRHQGANDEIHRATQRYEQAILYFRRGLQWAGSPYAWCSLGSALVIHSEAYCAARGFPKRAGGEDFYLLNKLAKLGTIAQIKEVTIELEARISSRVPFGTGPAVKQILHLDEQGETYRYYHPELFAQLRVLLQWAIDKLPELIFQHADAHALIGNNKIHGALHSLHFDSFIQHARKQCAEPAAVVRHFHHWFDAFKTLKFLHFLQAAHYPPIALDEALAAAEAWQETGD